MNYVACRYVYNYVVATLSYYLCGDHDRIMWIMGRGLYIYKVPLNNHIKAIKNLPSLYSYVVVSKHYDL